MNSIQINQLLKSNPATSKNFIGVFPFDFKPTSIKSFPCCFVINTHKHNLPGEHWLAIHINEQKNADFFDSYGNSPKFFRLEKYLNKIANQVEFNSMCIQNNFSFLCGHYCVFFLYCKCLGLSFLKFFSDDKIKNDKIIMKKIKLL